MEQLSSTKKILIIFLLWFFVVNIFALFALNRLNLSTDTAYTWITPENFSQHQGWNIADLHARWDSEWYLDIAKNGYSVPDRPDHFANIVFFPLYPLLIRLVAFFLGGNFILAGWALSSLFLFLALIYFYRLVKEFHKNVDPFLAISFLLIFPTSFFFNSIYTESPFLFFSIAGFYYALKRDFLKAGIFGFFASLTRLSGIFLFLPFVLEYIQSNDTKKLLSTKVVPLFLIPLGTFLFFLFHYIKFGNFFLFFQVEKQGWGRSILQVEGGHFALFSNPSIVNLTLDISFLFMAFLALYFVWRKISSSYALYMATTLFVPLSTGTLMSIGRYIIVLFPLFIWVASIQNQYVRQAFAFISILLLGMYITLFVNNYWAG